MLPQYFPNNRTNGVGAVGPAVLELVTFESLPVSTPSNIKHEAFNLSNELANYKREQKATLGNPELTKRVDQAFLQQLNMFIGEYMSSLSEFKYDYYFNTDGQLQSEGWSDSAIENYINAMNDPKQDEFTRQIRTAEAMSFDKIQSLMQSVKIIKDAARVEAKEIEKSRPTKAILQSPAENYPGSPYSFVSFYEIVEVPREELDEKGTAKVEFKVQVRNRKIFPDPDPDGTTDGTTFEQHLRARNTWLDHFAAQNETAYTMDERHPLSTPSLDLLASITVLPESANFDTLIEAYAQQQLIWQDEGIQRKLITFAPEIQRFFEIFKQYENNGEVDEKLENAFKILLVKAKVHLDEDEANGRWGVEIVNNIRNGLANDDTILLLQLSISGSCGNIDFSNGGGIVGGTSINGLIDAFHTFSMPWDKAAIPDYSTGRTDPVICSCGCKWYVKNEDSSTYKDCCPNPWCKKPQKCISATVPVSNFTPDSQEPVYTEN